jgi:hypothetical protein
MSCWVNITALDNPLEKFLKQSRFAFPPELAKELELAKKPVKLKKRALTGMRQWQHDAKINLERLRELSLPRSVISRHKKP